MHLCRTFPEAPASGPSWPGLLPAAGSLRSQRSASAPRSGRHTLRAAAHQRLSAAPPGSWSCLRPSPRRPCPRLRSGSLPLPRPAQTFPHCQGLPPRGSWRRSAPTERVSPLPGCSASAPRSAGPAALLPAAGRAAQWHCLPRSLPLQMRWLSRWESCPRQRTERFRPRPQHHRLQTSADQWHLPCLRAC